MRPNHAHRPLGVRHPLGHRQRDSKRSVPSGDRHNRGYPFRNRLLRLHPAKNIDDCVTYILNYVQKSGCNGFTDGEIYGQAVHYYDENEIEVGKPIQCQVAVNHVVELTAEEKAEARQNAIRQYQDEELRKLQKKYNNPHYLI